ncbi:MAG: hypothetical protein HFF18_01070 [Oscillospiraceae bacterium]|nr:hypothetical protein [Oscillospiraceae bacterium]
MAREQSCAVTTALAMSSLVLIFGGSGLTSWVISAFSEISQAVGSFGQTLAGSDPAGGTGCTSE